MDGETPPTSRPGRQGRPLRAAEEWLRAVLEHSPVILFAVDDRGVVTLSAGRGFETLGVRAHDHVGRSVFELYKDQPQVLAHVRRALAGEEFSAETEMRGAVYEIRYIPLREDAGVRGMLGVGTDLTERRRSERSAQSRIRDLEESAAKASAAESSLRGAEERLRTVLARAPIVLFALNPEGFFTLAEGLGLEALGLGPEQLVGRSVFSAFERDERFLASVRRALEGREFTAEIELRGLNFETRFAPLRSGDALSGTIGVATDITERRQAERSARRQSLAMEGAMDGIAIVNSNDEFVYANRAYASILGLPAPSALIGKSWRAGFEREERDRFERAVLPEFTRDGRWRGESVVARCDGSPVPVELSISALDGGGLVCVLRDASERRQAKDEIERLFLREQAARASAEAARMDFVFLDEASRMLDSSFDYLLTLPEVARHSLTYACDACFIDLLEEDRSIRRAAAAGPKGLCVEHLPRLAECHPVDVADDHPIAAAMRTGQAQLLAEVGDPEALAACGDEAHREAFRELGSRSALVVPILTRHRMVGAMTWVSTGPGRRLTAESMGLARELARRLAGRVESARLYQTLDQMHQMKTRLLAIASHDLRAPLQISLTYTQMLLGREAGDINPEQEQFLLRILKVINDQQRLVESLLDVTLLGRKRLFVHRRPLDLSALAAEIGETAGQMCRAGGLECTVAAAEGVRVLGDEIRLRQLALNLIQNACKFTRRGGTVQLRLERRGEEAVLAVADSGAGIPREALARIFQALYQAPVDGASGGGLGLGLAIVKEIAEAHGGRAWAESEGRGKGSVFLVALPLASEGSQGQAPVTP